MSKTMQRAIFVLGLVILSLPLAAQNFEDDYGVMVVGNGRVTVQKRGGGVVELNLNKAQQYQKGSGWVHVQVGDPGGKGAGGFKYSEGDGTFESHANGNSLNGKINSDGTVTIGGVTCDGRKDTQCIANALANFLEASNVPTESVAALRHALMDLDPTKILRGGELQTVFKLLVREMARRDNARGNGKGNS